MTAVASGRFVVIEGIDGAGTTTQAARLVDRLQADCVDAHLTREPSTGPVGVLLREMLTGRHAPVDSTTLGLLFAADRADHLQREIEPALARGAVVVSDRYYHSSLAYQGDDSTRDWVRVLNERARRPDLTVLLRVDPDEAARRRAADGRAEELFDAAETQRRIARNYERVVEELGATERVVAVDGHQSVDAVADEIADLVRNLREPTPADHP